MKRLLKFNESKEDIKDDEFKKSESYLDIYVSYQNPFVIISSDDEKTFITFI